MSRISCVSVLSLMTCQERTVFRDIGVYKLQCHASALDEQRRRDVDMSKGDDMWVKRSIA